MSIPADMLGKIMEGSALSPPPGVTSNFIDPPNFTTAILIVQVIFFVLPTFAVFIRMYIKFRISKSRNLEDYICFLAWAMFVSLYVPARLMPPTAAGRHQWDVKVKDLRSFLYYFHIGTIQYNYIAFAIKVSILLQYIRIFSFAQRGAFYWTCHSLIWLNFAFYTTCFFVEVFPCRPLAKIWDPLILNGSCLNLNAISISTAIVNVASDLTIVFLPQPIIWRLRMSFRSRLGVSLIFAAAALACISSALRLYYGHAFSQTHDLTWYKSLMTIYVYPELGLGIFVSCLPSLPKFFRTLHEGSFFSDLGTSLYSLFGLTRSERPTGASGTSKISKNPLSGDKPRLDTFDRLVETHELGSLFKKPMIDNSVTEEVELAAPHIAAGNGEIIRTVKVVSESHSSSGRKAQILPQHGLDSKPWQGNHDCQASVAMRTSH